LDFGLEARGAVANRLRAIENRQSKIQNPRIAMPLRTLPILEQWDCHNCGVCCYGNIIRLDDDDLARIKAQRWEDDPDYRGVRTVVSHGLVNKTYTLVQRPDGGCVFLTPQGRCRIHEVHGYDAKPRICKTFPLQVVPVENSAILTTRRSCPSAAQNKGRPLAEHIAAVEQLVAPELAEIGGQQPPPISRGISRDWRDTRRAAGALERLMTDRRFPLVRRWIHGLQFCQLIADCRGRKLRSLKGPEFAELMSIFEAAALEGAGRWFSERTAPAKWAAALFRQAGGEYLRPHPRSAAQPNWRERLRLGRAAWTLARGKGKLPQLVAGFRAETFEDLEAPLGALSPDVLTPLDAYFETLIASWRYAALGYRGWSLVDGYRAAALSFAVALWLFRWASGDRRQSDEIIPIIGCLDRSQGYAPLVGARHRRRVNTLAQDGQLQRLVAWYAR
jgi:lysine-N-methylase